MTVLHSWMSYTIVCTSSTHESFQGQFMNVFITSYSSVHLITQWIISRRIHECLTSLWAPYHPMKHIKDNSWMYYIIESTSGSISRRIHECITSQWAPQETFQGESMNILHHCEHLMKHFKENSWMYYIIVSTSWNISRRIHECITS